MQQLLDQLSLARRWKLSPRTLERWRWLELGPPFLKVGGRVLYHLDDIEAFEVSCRRNAGSTPVGGRQIAGAAPRARAGNAGSASR